MLEVLLAYSSNLFRFSAFTKESKDKPLLYLKVFFCTSHLDLVVVSECMSMLQGIRMLWKSGKRSRGIVVAVRVFFGKALRERKIFVMQDVEDENSRKLF